MEQLFLHIPEEEPVASRLPLESEIGKRTVRLMACAIHTVLVSEGGHGHEQRKPESQNHIRASSA